MKFKIRVKSDTGREWVEEFEREIGQANSVQGYPVQPTFTGDAEAWGRALIEWFNEGCQPGQPRRTFLGVITE